MVVLLLHGFDVLHITGYLALRFLLVLCPCRNNKFLIDSVLALRLNNWDRLVSDESNHDTSFPQAELAALDISSVSDRNKQ